MTIALLLKLILLNSQEIIVRKWKLFIQKKDVVVDMLVIVVCLLLKVNGCCLLMLTIFFIPGFLEILDEYVDTDYDMITFRAESVDSIHLFQ